MGAIAEGLVLGRFAAADVSGLALVALIRPCGGVRHGQERGPLVAPVAPRLRLAAPARAPQVPLPLLDLHLHRLQSPRHHHFLRDVDRADDPALDVALILHMQRLTGSFFWDPFFAFGCKSRDDPERLPARDGGRHSSQDSTPGLSAPDLRWTARGWRVESCFRLPVYIGLCYNPARGFPLAPLTVYVAQSANTRTTCPSTCV
eukprot:1189412-Prorocentrum_minimum.AAC.2